MGWKFQPWQVCLPITASLGLYSSCLFLLRGSWTPAPPTMRMWGGHFPSQAWSSVWNCSGGSNPGVCWTLVPHHYPVIELLTAQEESLKDTWGHILHHIPPSQQAARIQTRRADFRAGATCLLAPTAPPRQNSETGEMRASVQPAGAQQLQPGPPALIFLLLPGNGVKAGRDPVLQGHPSVFTWWREHLWLAEPSHQH